MTDAMDNQTSERELRSDAFLRMIRRAQRGKLKIYLGYAAGVGKTYQMLEEAHRLHEDGIDVVVGYVETHRRVETAALLEGLEVLPRRTASYRGVTIEEMDTDAVIARKPTVALVDELAHTNLAGSKYPKRYQDVQDILAAGIHVITTLNVQHLESLYDTVESALKIKVRERIPDSVLADADEIINVDLSEEGLRQRLHEGKVYTEERIETALDSFFQKRNLEMLRELTMRELASHIDMRRRAPEGEPAAPAPDLVMVCLSSRGPNRDRLLRYASRVAGRLNRDWYAVYVQTHKEAPLAIDAQTQRDLSNTLTLARQLGALVFTYKGEDIAGTLLQFAREYRVGHIILGRPVDTLSLLQRLMGRRDVVEELIHRAAGISITSLDTRGTPAYYPAATKDRAPDPAHSPQPSALPAPQSPVIPPLTDFLHADNIIVWNEPVPKDRILKELCAAAAVRSGLDPAIAYTATLAREELGTTFLNEGVAFPHARIEQLQSPCMALGVPSLEIMDVETEQPIRLVFLILTPTSQPDTQVRLLAAASRAAIAKAHAIAAARTPEEVLIGLTASESGETEDGDA